MRRSSGCVFVLSRFIGVVADKSQNLYMTGLMPDAITVALRDSNQVAHLLPVVEHSLETVCLAEQS